MNGGSPENGFRCHQEESIMDLNSVFLLVLAIVVAVGACCMGYNHACGKKQSSGGADQA